MFIGIPEIVRTDQDDEDNSNKQKQETWQETEKLLAEKIAEVCEISVARATEKLERVHRSAQIRDTKITRLNPFLQQCMTGSLGKVQRNFQGQEPIQNIPVLLRAKIWANDPAEKKPGQAGKKNSRGEKRDPFCFCCLSC